MKANTKIKSIWTGGSEIRPSSTYAAEGVLLSLHINGSRLSPDDSEAAQRLFDSIGESLREFAASTEQIYPTIHAAASAKQLDSHNKADDNDIIPQGTPSSIPGQSFWE